MLYFPQLSSGASGQFPLVRQTFRRVIRNEQVDGRQWKATDEWGGGQSWLLRYRGLTAAECREVENLFHAVEGRRGTFVFLDPAANLLVWSEDLSKDAWTRDPFREVLGGVGDPFGGTGATRLRNAGTVTQKIEQALAVPSWYQYCLSVWIRSEGSGEVTLFGRSGSQGEARTVHAPSGWKRVNLPVKLGGSEEVVRFGLEASGGQSVDVYGLQVEAQAAASGYKRTRSRGGVHRAARFGQDVLEVVAEGPDCFGFTVTVVVPV